LDLADFGKWRFLIDGSRYAKRYGKPDISFLDFLALAHYDDSPDYADAMKITAENLRHQLKR